jgi:hypothetical protein
MNLRTVSQRLAKADVKYVLGRFRIVRQSYSQMRRVHDVFTRPSHPAEQRPTLFPGVSVADAVRDIRTEAVCFGLRLPPPIVSAIEAFALTEPLHPGNDPTGARFYHRDVVRGRTPDGRGVPLGGVRDPQRSPAVRAVVEDPVLRAIVRGYLRYEPTRVLPLLTWSFASDFTDEERRTLKHHVIDYHYDVGGYNFVYASFYIRDTDRHSGAHVMMKRSHVGKPLSMLLGSAVAPASEVHRRFGQDNEIMIEGPAGTGFVQDTSCYHRATPPTQRDRLLLQVRFS